MKKIVLAATFVVGLSLASFAQDNKATTVAPAKAPVAAATTAPVVPTAVVNPNAAEINFEKDVHDFNSDCL